jgi:hypothetical protein
MFGGMTRGAPMAVLPEDEIGFPVGRQPGGLFGKPRMGTPVRLPVNGEGQPMVPPRVAGNSTPGLPGPISGYGGGTWNVDGSAATPDQSGNMRPLPGSGALQARQPAPNHWTVEGFDKLRDAIPNRTQLPVPANDGPLGGSMRAPFDYDKAMEILAGNQKKPKWWQYGLATLGDALAINRGVQPYAMQSLVGQRNSQQQRLQEAAEQLMKWRYQDHSRQNEADLRAANPFTIGRDRVMYDPASGQSNVIYDGAEDFELYAEKLGLEPGSPDYFQAVEDFVLRSSGPSAHERDIELDDHRTGNDASLERLRYGNRVGMENLRQGNRRGMVDYRNANPAPSRSSKPRVVSVKTPAEAAKLKLGTIYRGPDGVVRER